MVMVGSFKTLMKRDLIIKISVLMDEKYSWSDALLMELMPL